MNNVNPNYKYNTVLLIDDSELDNFINEKMLDANLFSKNVLTSLNGEIALNVINKLIHSDETGNESCLDLVFVDLNMPVMTGFEFIENFKRLRAGKITKTKLVILTSSIDNEDRLKASKIDENIIFVNKPLTNEVLRSL